MTATEPSPMASNQPKPNTDPTTRPPPPLVRMIETPNKGRAMIATRLIKPGQIVMVDAPIVVYPSSLRSLPIFCSRCFRILPAEPFRCPSCDVARFCSHQCAFLSHPRLLCHALPSLIQGKATWPDDMLFILSAYSLPPKKFSQLLSLQSGSSFPDDSIDKLHFELDSLLPANVAPSYFSRENTASLMSKEKNNSFMLVNPANPKYERCGVAGARAYGIYFWSAMLNHDCMPNVCRFDDVDDPHQENNTDFVFRALHEIEEGSEICSSYISVTMGYKERQKMLNRNYDFKCECERCKVESRWKKNHEEEEEEQQSAEEIEEMNKDETEEGSEEGTEEEIGVESEEEEEETEDQEDDEVNAEEEMEMSTEDGDDGDDGFMIADYMGRYICDCRGLLAPMPPSQDGAVSNLMECNGCGAIIKDKYGGAGGANS